MNRWWLVVLAAAVGVNACSSARDAARPAAGRTVAARSSAATAVWYDGTRLLTGYISLNGRVSERAGPQVSASYLRPVVAAGGRLYWVNPGGSAMSSTPPAAAHPGVVQYMDLATGKIGIVGPGDTAFLSADGRSVLIAQDPSTLGELPAAGGALRQLTLPRGWYLPGGDGNPILGFSDLATANGVIVVARPGGGWMQQRFGLWNPGRRTVRVLGRAYSVIGAYTPPGARSSLLAWEQPVCARAPACYALLITNTATGATRGVFSPLPGGFAQGGAFSPDGTQLAVFTQTLPHGTTPGQARLALVNLRAGATSSTAAPCSATWRTCSIRVAAGVRMTLGMNIGSALWLPDGRHLIVGAASRRSYLVDAATLAAKPLFLVTGSNAGNGHPINFTAVVLPSRS